MDLKQYTKHTHLNRIASAMAVDLIASGHMCETQGWPDKPFMVYTNDKVSKITVPMKNRNANKTELFFELVDELKERIKNSVINYNNPYPNGWGLKQSIRSYYRIFSTVKK